MSNAGFVFLNMKFLSQKFTYLYNKTENFRHCQAAERLSHYFSSRITFLMTEKENSLVRDLLDAVQESTNGIDKHPEYDVMKNNFHLLTERGQYTMKVFNLYNRILDLITDLRSIEIFLKRFPLSKFYEKNEIDILSYLKYHTEVFYHKIATILDILKLMVNEVYELNIPEENCSWDNLKKRLDVAKTPELLIIESYYKSFKHIISARHLNTHQAYYYDKDTDDMRAPLLLYKNREMFDSEVDDNFRKFYPEGLLKFRIREFRKKRLEYIKNGNNVADEYSNMFVNVILINFLKKRNLKNNGS